MNSSSFFYSKKLQVRFHERHSVVFYGPRDACINNIRRAPSHTVQQSLPVTAGSNPQSGVSTQQSVVSRLRLPMVRSQVRYQSEILSSTMRFCYSGSSEKQSHGQTVTLHSYAPSGGVNLGWAKNRAVITVLRVLTKKFTTSYVIKKISIHKSRLTLFK